MPVETLRHNTELSSVVYSLNQLDRAIDKIEINASEVNKQELQIALDFTYSAVNEYFQVSANTDDDLKASQQELLLVIDQVTNELEMPDRLNEISLQSLHARYKEAITPFAQNYIMQSKSALTRLIRQTTEVSRLKNSALLISISLSISLFLITLIWWSRQRTTFRLAQTQAEKNRTEALLHAVVDNAAAGIYIKDIEGRYVLCNSTFCDWHDVPFEQLEGKTVWDIFTPEKAQLFSDKDKECCETKSAIEHESEISLADGSVKSEYTVRFPEIGRAHV